MKRDGAVVHSESETFERRQAAAAWLEKRERELKQPGAIERAKVPKVTLADAIDQYIKESRKEIRRTKAQVLSAIKRYPIADKNCDDIGSAEIVTFAGELSKGRSAATVGNYLSHLAAIFQVAKPAWNYPLDPAAMNDARTVLVRMGQVAKSKKRDRRPTIDEIDRLIQHFGRRARQASPMGLIIVFALFSTRRQEEIVQIQWKDLDEAHSRILVKDMKHPNEKVGNDTWVDLPEEALRVIKAMPRRNARIFPYTAGSISASFTRSTALLGIEDLHFHDLRHEGISRLFEMGWSIPKVACVSGHRSWSSLQRYTHLRESGDKWSGWRGLEIVTSKHSIKPIEAVESPTSEDLLESE